MFIQFLLDYTLYIFIFSVPPSTVNLKITPSRPRAGEMVTLFAYSYYVRRHKALYCKLLIAQIADSDIEKPYELTLYNVNSFI